MEIQYFVLLIHVYRYLRSNKSALMLAAKLSSVSQISNENSNGNIVTPTSPKTNAPFGVQGIFFLIILIIYFVCFTIDARY